ncbi:DNA-directed RNA polymerase I subunit RPA12 isoform X2 [Lepisosteus oculatus]|uniref:DNA-directed RNA polymerase I subunit RPA12 isoform X2 n=1 Tax=Lepisosteus oculatus TaxID=7918 RepID=UPI0035F5174B
MPARIERHFRCRADVMRPSSPQPGRALDCVCVLRTTRVSAQQRAMSADALPGSCFHGDPLFCPECGTVLPVPGVEDVVSCRRCGYDIGVSELADQVVTSSVVFNSLESSSTAMMSEEEGELKGPVIDRRCSRCGREGMVYHTRQMRSADEGQTVFYTCTHCRYQEKEDS